MIFRRLKKKKASEPRHEDAGPSIIASDVIIDGNLSTGGELQIDGTVHGMVRARSCVIDMQGVVEGEIIAEEVFVRGRVIGPIRGIHVHLHAGAHVEGDVINETISIENGAYIYGSIRRSEDPLAAPVHHNGYPVATVPANRPQQPLEPGFGPFDQELISRPVRTIRPR